jgi:hypothetical protein
MLTIENHGSLALIRPDSEDTQTLNIWADDNIAEFSFFGFALVVEPRFVADITAALVDDGFEFEEG